MNQVDVDVISTVLVDTVKAALDPLIKRLEHLEQRHGVQRQPGETDEVKRLVEDALREARA